MAIIKVYKKGSSTDINDFDLAAYKKMGWSTSQSAAPAPAATPVKTTTTKTRTAAQQAAIDRQLAIEKAAGVPQKGATPTPTPAATPTPAPVASPTPTPTPAPSTGGYTIKSGDTLSAIAKANNTTVDALMKANPTLTDPNKIMAGASLTLPTASQSPAGLNTVGLMEAYARRQSGKASATDIANLDYAMSKGWSPSGTPSATPTTASTPAASGVQNIPGLNTVGLNEAYARKVAGTANATDLENLSYAESKGWKAPTASEVVTDPKAANDIINAEQDADIAAKTVSDEPTTRSSVEDIMGYLKEKVTPDTAAPEAPKYEQSLTELRTEYGVSQLEDSLNSLKTEQNTLIAEYQKLFGQERNKTVALGVIGGRISEEERQMNERLTAIGNVITNVTDQLNTKYGIIETIMSAKELDYNTAAKAYDTQMQENISLFNAAQNIQESLKTEEQRAVDSARASAQIMLNGFATAGLTFDKLSPTQQTTMRKLAVQSGFDAGFYETLLSVTQEVQKDILTSVISDDKAYATIIYKDGTTATIATGQPSGSNKPANGSGSGGYSGVSSSATVGDVYNVKTSADRTAISKAATAAGMTFEAFLALPIDEGNKYMFPDEDAEKALKNQQTYKNAIDAYLEDGLKASEILGKIKEKMTDNGETQEVFNTIIDYLKNVAKERDKGKWKMGDYVGDDI